MVKDTIIFKCRCCGAVYHVNFTARKVTFLEKPGDKQKKELEEILERAEKEKEERESKFEKALEGTEKEKQRLEKLFEEAKKKAEKEEPERPPSIFDLD